MKPSTVNIEIAWTFDHEATIRVGGDLRDMGVHSDYRTMEDK